MNWIEFKNKMFDLGCFSIHQVYAWQPGFDRNNLVRWTKKGYLVHLRRGWYAFPEYKDKPEFAEHIAGRIYNPSYFSKIYEKHFQISLINPETCSVRNKIFIANLGTINIKSR